jgi:hypothetical protein
MSTSPDDHGRQSQNLQPVFEREINDLWDLFFDDPDAFTVHAIERRDNIDQELYKDLASILRQRGFAVSTNQYFDTPGFRAYARHTVNQTLLFFRLKRFWEHVADKY